jgi:putative Mg2+ transporter-C (MgtC) family protein
MESFWNEIEMYRDGGLPLLDITARLGLAAFLGILLGIERARREQSAGMRTYGVVSMASALIMIVSIYGVPELEGGRQDPGRIAAQVVSGIGFLGAGLIFMRRNVVHGLTTAAMLWAASGVGLAVGGGMMVTGSLATGFLLLISGGLHPVKKRLFHQDSSDHRLILSLSNPSTVVPEIRKLALKSPGFELTSLDLDTNGDKKHSKLDIRLRVQDPDDAITIVREIEMLEGVERLNWHAGGLDH